MRTVTTWRGPRSILEAVGTVDEVDEALLDAFTGVAGSGPAYVFLVAEALIDGGCRRAASSPTWPHGWCDNSCSSVLRPCSTARATRRALREMVTSPNGTTAAGLAALDDHDVRGAVGAAVRAATQRSRELASS